MLSRYILTSHVWLTQIRDSRTFSNCFVHNVYSVLKPLGLVHVSRTWVTRVQILAWSNISKLNILSYLGGQRETHKKSNKTCDDSQNVVELVSSCLVDGADPCHNTMPYCKLKKEEDKNRHLDILNHYTKLMIGIYHFRKKTHSCKYSNTL